MKQIPKFQQSGVFSTDATRVTRPAQPFYIQRTLQPGETLFRDPHTGVLTVVRPRQQAQISATSEAQRNYNNSAQAQRDRRTAEYLHRKQRDAKAIYDTVTVTGEVLDRVRPSHIAQTVVDAAKGNLAKSLVEGNQGIGPEAVNVAFDFLAPAALAKGTQTLFKGFQTLKGKDLTNAVKNTFKSFGLNNDPKINLNADGTWNLQKIVQDVQKGSKDAQDFLGSTIKAESDKHNIELANRIGLKHFTPYKDAQARATYPVKPNFGNLTKPEEITLGSVHIDPMGPKYDTMDLNLYGELEPTVFHEQLHRGYYGMADGSVYNPTQGSVTGWNDRFNDTNAFYRWKTQKLLAPRSSENWRGHDYLTDDGEAAANFLEVGKRMGISPGTPYPGKQKALEQFQKFADSGNNKSFVIQTANMNKPKRVWDAITGKYFVIPTLVAGYTGYNWLNNNNNFGNQLNQQ